MKILVFDDSPIHRKAAELSLKGHDLTVVGTYDEAQEALLPKVNEEQRKQIFSEKFGDRDPYKSEGLTKELRQERMDYYWATQEQATVYPNFDVVLTDLLVPASRQAQGREGSQFVGQEMPIGTTIALLALVAGIKKVAVVTDMNHHNHPASAMFDCFGKCKNPGVNIICTNHVDMIAIDEASGQLVDQKPQESKGLTRGKDWGSILKQLIGEKTAE
ncbi:MAG: hypothetical protein WCW14_03155 [Candidatus Paceibacterota bacterium]